VGLFLLRVQFGGKKVAYTGTLGVAWPQSISRWISSTYCRAIILFEEYRRRVEVWAVYLVYVSFWFI